MRVFVAGGSGAIGRVLVPALLAAGHEVAATSRSKEGLVAIRDGGAEPVQLDVFDAPAVAAAMTRFRPDAVMHQLTALPQDFVLSRLGPYYEMTGRLRTEGTRNLLAAAKTAGAGRFIYQSIAFLYRLTGPPVLEEDAPLALDAPDPFGITIRATAEGERLALEAGGVVLRYGQLYGPGTYYGREGWFGREARKRRLPVVGDGGGIFSFLHLDDAAASAIAALERGAGIYNVVDDEPAPARDWIPVFCRAVGAPPPLHIPAWVARLLAGEQAVVQMTSARGASNAKAKRELGWKPLHPTWQTGFGVAVD